MSKIIYEDFQISKNIFCDEDELYDMIEYLIKIHINSKYKQVEAISNLKITIHFGLFIGVKYTATIVDDDDIHNVDNITKIEKIQYKQVEVTQCEKTKVPFVVIEQKNGINKKNSSYDDDNKLIPGIGLVPRGFKIKQHCDNNDNK